MTGHRFDCGDVPGTFYCPAVGCNATAHYERDEQRYCIHPSDGDSAAFLVETWTAVPDAVHHLHLADGCEECTQLAADSRVLVLAIERGLLAADVAAQLQLEAGGAR